MSRRKQAKPRALKREEEWESECGEEPPEGAASDDMIPPTAGDEGSPVPTATGSSSSPPPTLVRQPNGDIASNSNIKGEEDEEKTPRSSTDPGQQAAGPHYDVTLEGLQLALMDRHGYQGENSSMSEGFAGNGGVDTVSSSRLLSPPPTTSSAVAGTSAVVPGEADNSLESDALGTDPGSSWRSETPEDQTSPSPSSCATPNSATDVPDAELTFTVGVTEGTPYACQFCDKAFPRLSYLKKHEQTHSDQMPFRCEFCSRLFKHKRSRDRHIKLHTGDKKYRCTHCEAAFSRSDHLKIHMKTHDNQKPFQCTVCNRGYNTAAALTSHMQNHKKDQQQQQQNGHNNSNSSRTSSNNTPSPGAACPSFRCLQCGETFRKPEELQGHMMTQHNVETGGSPPGPIGRGLLGGLMLGDSPLARSPSRPLPFPTPKLACIYCTKDSFTTMEALQLHVQAMHGSILNGDLRDFPSLSHHQASPSPSLTPHHLLTSPNGGSNSSNNHTVTSTALMPYSCDLCTMRFGTVQGLQKHALAVHGLSMGLGNKDHHGDSANSTPVPGLYCVQCSLSFPSAASFAEHYVLMHGSSSASGGLMIPSSPAPEQLKPTDLSKKPHRHSQHHEDRSPSKRHKSSAENSIPPPVSMPETPTSASGMINQYEHPGTLLCNQCSAALPDFESFRTHLKSHLEEAGGLRGLLGGGSDIMSMLTNPDRVNSSKSPATSGALVCPHCGAKFSGSDEHQAYEQHVATHFMATATEYGCQSCLKLFPKPDELQKHLMDIHAHHLYRCSLCKEMFDSKVAIQVHFAVKHSNECKLFRCTACASSSAVFRSELDFSLHVRSAHAPLPLLAGATNKTPTPQPYRCLFCRLSFATELEMQFHLAAHSKQFHCPLCQEAFHVEFLLDKHMQTHHSSQVLNSNGTSSAENLSQQQKSPKNKNSGMPPSATTLNNSNNSSISNSSASRNSGNNESSSNKKEQVSNSCCCDICDRCDFSSEAELTAHRKLVHHIKPNAGKNGAVSLHCAYCSENCKSRTELENHMKTHSQGGGSSGKHKCNICDELCPSAAVLAEHKLTHCKVISGSTCTQCKATLVNEEQFYTHLQQHSSNNNNSSSSAQANTNSAQVVLPTPCVVCRQTLISDIEVRMHARFHLKNSAAMTATEPMYQCCLCLKQFELQNLIVAGGSNGVVPSIQGATYICKDCYHCHSKASPSQQQVSSQQQQQQQQHLGLAMQQDQTFRCSECQVKFETSSALEAHLVSVHRKTYQCIKCQVSFETEREIQMHVATHLLTEGSSHECHLCRRLLATPLKLQAHLIEHTFAGCGSFTCYLCSAVFTAAQGLQQHMLEHGLAARPYDCSRCSLRFFFRAELDNHSYSHLEEDNAALANSSGLLDGSDMATKAAYYHHLSTNGNYEASNPDMHYYKTLVQESSKQQKHKNSKSLSSKGGPMLKCLECNKEFSSMLGLQAHQRHHKHSPSTSKKTYSCNECGKEFGMARNLSVHMRSHHEDHRGEERPVEEMNAESEEHYEGEGSKLGHVCPVCCKDFPDDESLDGHIASHHFRCPQCGELFARQRHMAEHARKAHSGENEHYVMTGDHPAEINAMELKQEPISIKEENEDENIDVSSLTPTADQQYIGSPQHHTSELEDSNTQNNENSQANPLSPIGTLPGSNSIDEEGHNTSPPSTNDIGDSH